MPIVVALRAGLSAPQEMIAQVQRLLEQIVEAKYGDREFTFHCLLEVDPKLLVLVGMTPFNTRAFTLTLTDESFTIDMAPGAQLPAQPSQILADLQLALWPDLPSVRGLEAGLFLGYGPSHSYGGRAFWRNGTEIIRIWYDEDVPATSKEFWRGPIVFEHLEQNYSLRVTTIRAEKLAP